MRFNWLGYGSFSDFSSIVVRIQKSFGQSLLINVFFVLSLFEELDGLSVCSLVAFIDSHNPSLAGESLCEIVQLEIFVSRVGVSDIIISFGFAVSSIYLPGSVIA